MSTARQTRSKKGKAAAAAATAAAADASADGGAPSTLSLTIPDDLDVEIIQNTLPDLDLHAPSADAVVQIYRHLQDQVESVERLQTELDEVQAELERKDIELDQALQDKESALLEGDKGLGALQADLSRVKKERDELDAAKSSLESQLSTLNSSQSASSTELGSLKQQVSDLEREKRELLNVVNRLKEEGSQRDEEVQSLRTNLKEARQEHQQLESQVRDLRSSDTATKETLKQQLQLAQSEATRTNEELENKIDEFTKYRRAKQAELSELQSTHDALLQTHSATQSSLKSLQSTHTVQTRQLDDALEKVQDLTGKLAEQEAMYQSEAQGLRSLIEKMEDREQKAKSIVDTLENEWATVGEKAQLREDILKEERDREASRREEAEERILQLEAVLDRIGRGELPVPRREALDVISDGLTRLSPTVAMASKAQKGGKSFTEVYADYVKLQDEYSKKCTEYNHMDNTLTRILAEIEERAPVMREQREEYGRLQVETSQLTAQLSQVISERDMHATYAKETASKLAASLKENASLSTNLTDLGAQIKRLLAQIARRDDPTIPSDEELESEPPADTEPSDSIDAVITNNLVLFRNLGEMQEQNQKLLKIVRELGAKMESEEKDYKEVLEREQAEAVREAHEAIQELVGQLERQKQSSDATIKAYVAERDALKLRLGRAEKNGPLAVTNGAASGDTAVVLRETEDQEMADMRQHFDTFKSEMEIDSVKLREQLLGAQSRANQLNSELAKANAKIEYLNDRNRMNQEQFEHKKSEILHLSQRNENLLMQYTRVDTECQHVMDELQTSETRLEKLRNENANLRAEKKIWEGVQVRLVEENRSLSKERSHLSDLMTNVQKMHNDLELSGQNDRRRLETQLQILEQQTQDMRNQLSQERDSVRHLSLQKDMETKEMQGKLDKLSTDFSSTRESLIGAETSKKHLEERVADLSKQLQASEEKLSVYERRPGANSGSPPLGTQVPAASDGSAQQLQAEVADLRAALKVAQMDLATAKSHVEQFKAISKANEDALESLHRTHDDYKVTTEAQITLSDSKAESLQQKISDAKEEITALNTKLSELQKTFDTEKASWHIEKKELVATITELGMVEQNSESDRAAREREVKEQEQRTLAAEERYSREVISHAESMKSVDSLKAQLAQVTTQNRELQTKAETATATLADSEGSWNKQKEALDKENADLQTRCKELADQNTILHQHLESVSTQAARIRQAATTSAQDSTPGETEGSESTDTKLSELRSVVTYLRKEKEIVDLQLELSKQEVARFKAQIDRLTHSLDETRRSLSLEREKAVSSAASDLKHKELVERINQLNLLRESNTTLRAECDAQTKKTRALEAQLYDLTSQLDPLKEEARLAKAELQARNEQVVLLEEESKRWQERNTQLLSKYDRIDPADMQALKTQIEQLQAQVTGLQASNDEKEAQLKEAAEKLQKAETHFKERFEKNMARAKEYISVERNNVKDRDAEIVTLKESLEAATKDRDELLQIKTTLEEEKAALAAQAASQPEPAEDQSAAVAELQAERNKLVEERDKLLEERVKLTEERTALLEKSSSEPDPATTPAEWDAEKAELTKARDQALQDAKTAAEEVKKALAESKDTKTSVERLQTRVRELMQGRQADKTRAATELEEAVTAAVAKTKEEQASQPSPEQDPTKHAEELKALEERLVAEYEKKLKDAAASQLESGEVSEDQTKSIEAAVQKKFEEKIKQLEAERDAEHQKGLEAGRSELAIKLKLKDAALMKAQNKLKEVEGRVLEYEKSGTAASTSSGSVISAPSPTTAKPANGSAAANPATQAKPKVVPPLAALPNRPVPAARGGRGGAAAGRGGMVRRGGAPAAAAAAAAAAQSSAPTELSIAGAAVNKRPRDSEATPAEDAQAKRLKTVQEGATKPVTLRRPPAAS